MRSKIQIILGSMLAFGLVACDKGRHADSTANSRMEKIRCNNGFDLDKELEGRLEKANANSLAVERVFYSDITDQAKAKEIIDGVESLLTEKPTASAIAATAGKDFLIKDCSTLTASFVDPNAQADVQAQQFKIKDTNVGFIELEAEGLTVRIEKVMPDEKEKDARAEADRKDALGFNTIRTTKTMGSGIIVTDSVVGVLQDSDLVELADSILQIAGIQGIQGNQKPSVGGQAHGLEVTAGELKALAKILKR